MAIDKPHGLLVHKTKIANDARTFALQLLRDQINQRVYPAHRLDRKTSGILLFSKSEEYNKLLQAKFRNNEIKKEYKAIVRGYAPSELTIDYPLNNQDKLQDAVTLLRTSENFEIPLATNNFPTSRYSTVFLEPQSGRFHQLRKHMAHIFHPIIGDRPHGCNKQNRIWKEIIGISDMLLCATQLSFEIEGKKIEIIAPPSSSFSQALEYLKKEST